MLKKALSHLTGQSGVFAINALFGLLIIRLLPPTEYAVVVIALFLQVAACVLSDLGLTHALISKLSHGSSAQLLTATIMRAAISQKNQFSYLATPFVFIFGLILLRESVSSPLELITILIVSVVTGFFQSTLNLRKAALNISHDDRALLRLGLIESFTRVALLPLCVLFPTTFIVVAINLVATLLTILSLTRVAGGPPLGRQDACHALKTELRSGVVPLAPGVIYALFQGQIAILLLSILGEPQMVAEAGALGRLAQVINLLMVLNPFWVQPYFSRLNNKADVFFATTRLAVGLVCLVSLIWGSVVWLPDWWLMIIGEQYAHTTEELRVAMAGVLVHAVFAVSYTVALARGLVAGQHWAISLSIFLQFVFLASLGVHSVADALVLQMLPAIGGLLVQWILIGRYLISRERPIDAHN